MQAEPNQRVGRYIETTYGPEKVRAYIPAPLPPVPPVNMSSLQTLLDEANLALGALTAVSTILPEPTLFLYAYVRKEAVLSSQIEGTQSSLSDLIRHEAGDLPGVPIDDVTEVSNYVRALEHGLSRLGEGCPLSRRLLCEIHGVLLKDGRGAEKLPGEFRRSENWIGGARPGVAAFVPPPPEEVDECVSQLERFLHAPDSSMPLLIKAGLAHVQFETIHPFLDGNGRLGRLLITFLLCWQGVLEQPLLYLSLHFKRNRDTYYELLNRVRITGDWESWLEFFLAGVRDVSREAVSTAKRIQHLLERHRAEVSSRGTPAAQRLLLALPKHPIVSVRKAQEICNLSFQTAGSALSRLEAIGIVREVSNRQRGRRYAYKEYVDILMEDTEPLPR